MKMCEKRRRGFKLESNSHTHALRTWVLEEDYKVDNNNPSAVLKTRILTADKDGRNITYGLKKRTRSSRWKDQNPVSDEENSDIDEKYDNDNDKSNNSNDGYDKKQQDKEDIIVVDKIDYRSLQ